MERILLRGMSNVPADSACAKGDLVLCVGAVVEHGALAPVDPYFMSQSSEGGSSVDTGAVVAAAPMPVIEFGLQRAGYVAVSQSFRLPTLMCGVSGGGVAGSGAWTVHASSATKVANYDTAAKTVHNKLMQAIANQASGRGYFHQPFMVRYAVRMTDGTYVSVSPPVAMFPSMTPPRFAVASSVAVDDEESILTLSSASAYYCQLRYRIVQGLPSEVLKNVAAVDVFVSPQMLTYSDDTPCSDGVVDSQWQLLPDSSWTARLLANDKFYRVASLPASSLEAGDGFADVDVSDTSAKALERLPALSPAAANHLALLPEVMSVQGDHVIVAGSACRPGIVWPIRAMVPYADGATEVDIEMSVLAQDEAGAYRVSARCEGVIAGARYLYSDIPNAHAIVVNIDGTSTMFPLTPHPSLPGSYWWGGIEEEPERGLEVDEDTLPPETGETQCTARIEERYKANPWCPIKQWQLPCTEVRAVTRSLRAMSSGQFGQHSLYAFTDSGLWVLPNSDSAPVLISTDTCVNRDAVVAVEDGIAYASSRGVHMVKGSAVTKISDDLSGECSLDAGELPHIDTLMAICGDVHPVSFDSILSNARLSYDRLRSRLFVMGNGDMAYVYSLESGKWGMRVPYSEDDTHPLAVVTRPFRLDATPMNRVRAVGRLDSERCGICVYGSHDLNAWQVVASSSGVSTDAVTGTQYVYYVVAFAARLRPGDHLTHFEILT